MDIGNKYCIYFGTTRGVIGSTCCKSGEPVKYGFEDSGQNAEITALEWGRHDNEVIVGQKNGKVKLYDSSCQLESYVSDLKGNGPVVGNDPVDNRIIIAFKSGHINLWNKDENKYFTLNLSDDRTLERTRHNKSRTNLIATGGKSNDLNLWDIEATKCVFKAKSMGHDNLNLPIPTSIRDICFIDDGKLTACCTKEGHVLVYDERAQRRPVVKFLEPKASYTTMASAFNDRQCFVGTTKGYMQLLDLKAPPKIVQTFKAFTGSISGIVCDPVTSIVATVSLDRFLRIHNLHTKELVYKEYLKQSLTKLILKPIIKEESETKEENDESLEESVTEADEEYEELFENMETISDSKTSKIPKRTLQDHPEKVYKKSKRKKHTM